LCVARCSTSLTAAGFPLPGGLFLRSPHSSMKNNLPPLMRDLYPRVTAYLRAARCGVPSRAAGVTSSTRPGGRFSFTAAGFAYNSPVAAFNEERTPDDHSRVKNARLLHAPPPTLPHVPVVRVPMIFLLCHAFRPAGKGRDTPGRPSLPSSRRPALFSLFPNGILMFGRVAFRPSVSGKGLARCGDAGPAVFAYLAPLQWPHTIARVPVRCRHREIRPGRNPPAAVGVLFAPHRLHGRLRPVPARRRHHTASRRDGVRPVPAAFSTLPLCEDGLQSSACRRVTRHILQRTRPQLRYRLRPGLLA
jgi:hypothetical protein